MDEWERHYSCSSQELDDSFFGEVDGRVDSKAVD